MDGVQYQPMHARTRVREHVLFFCKKRKKSLHMCLVGWMSRPQPCNDKQRQRWIYLNMEYTHTHIYLIKFSAQFYCKCIHCGMLVNLMSQSDIIFFDVCTSNKESDDKTSINTLRLDILVVCCVLCVVCSPLYLL